MGRQMTFYETDGEKFIQALGNVADNLYKTTNIIEDVLNDLPAVELLEKTADELKNIAESLSKENPLMVVNIIKERAAFRAIFKKAIPYSNAALTGTEKAEINTIKNELAKKDVVLGDTEEIRTNCKYIEDATKRIQSANKFSSHKGF